jgi:hypothetical protein
MTEENKSAAPSEKLGELDRMALELAKSKEQTARSQYEASILATRHLVLQIYLKLGLTDQDVINEDGTIVRGGAAAAMAAQQAKQG